MYGVDVNCLLGHWPFRRLYKNTLADLVRVHTENNIRYGYVSSLNSIFYNDPFEGEEELHKLIGNTPYHHIMTVNPTLPCFTDDIRRAVQLFDIKGVRIYPGYHKYRLSDTCMRQLYTILRELGLPLLISIRIEDERLDYLLQQQGIDIHELQNLVESMPDIKILILNIRWGEILYCEKMILTLPHVFIDTSGFKDPVFCVEAILEHIGDRKILYGSAYPLFCLKSTYYEVTKADISKESVENILSKNSETFFLNS